MKWIEPSIDVAYYVGENLRVEDCKEVALSHGIAPTDAVVHSFLDSQKCSAFATELGEPWDGWCCRQQDLDAGDKESHGWPSCPLATAYGGSKMGGRMYQRGRALA